MLAPMQDLGDSPDSARHNSPNSWGDWQARAEEANLVARCQEGDLDAFETIYRRHSPSVYNLAFRMVGDRAEAEDLLQEIFLQAHNKLSTFEGRAAFGTWLYRLAVNRCLDHLRSAASQRQSLTTSFEESPEPFTVHDNLAQPRPRARYPAAPSLLSLRLSPLRRARPRPPRGRRHSGCCRGHLEITSSQGQVEAPRAVGRLSPGEKP